MSYRALCIRSEETRCRFCNNVLPDWRPALTPSALRPTSSVMSVRYRGVTHRITYTPGPDGLQHFLETLQGIGIKVASASQVTFLCRSPDTGMCRCTPTRGRHVVAWACDSAGQSSQAVHAAQPVQLPRPSAVTPPPCHVATRPLASKPKLLP